MRYYEQRYPEVDELVMVQVRQIAEMGAYVKLVRCNFLSTRSFPAHLMRRKVARVRQHRRHDPALRAVKKTNPIYPKTYPCRKE